MPSDEGRGEEWRILLVRLWWDKMAKTQIINGGFLKQRKYRSLETLGS